MEGALRMRRRRFDAVRGYEMRRSMLNSMIELLEMVKLKSSEFAMWGAWIPTDANMTSFRN